MGNSRIEKVKEFFNQPVVRSYVQKSAAREKRLVNTLKVQKACMYSANQFVKQMKKQSKLVLKQIETMRPHEAVCSLVNKERARRAHSGVEFILSLCWCMQKAFKN